MNRWARIVLFTAAMLAACYLFARARHGHNRQRVARRLGGLWNSPAATEPSSTPSAPEAAVPRYSAPNAEVSVSSPESVAAAPATPPETAAEAMPATTAQLATESPLLDVVEAAGGDAEEPTTAGPDWSDWLKTAGTAEPSPAPPFGTEPSESIVPELVADGDVELDVVTSAFNELAAEGAALEAEEALLAGLEDENARAETPAAEVQASASVLVAEIDAPPPTPVAKPAPPAEPDVVFPEALEEALASMDHAPVRSVTARNAEAYLDEGNVYFNVGQYSLAIDRYARALEADNTLVAAFYNRANALTRSGDYESALRDYDRALELQPGDADALNNRGMLRLYRAQYEAALKDFDLALGLEPSDTTVMVNRGLAYLHSGNPKEALADFEAATSVDANDAAAFYGAGQAAAQMGNRQSAIRHLRRALQVDPGYSREAAGDPKLASLQGDGDFIRLLRDAGAR